MSRPVALGVDSATGVEVALPVVGAGGRAYAFVLDWHIRLLLALAWYVCGALLHSTLMRGGPSLAVPFDPDPTWFLGVVLPTASIYFLYHPILEVLLHGRTPGKRFAGLRIVTREGNAPGVGALLVRNVFRLIDSFPGLYCVGLVATLVTRESVRLGDLAAGTLLIYERERAVLPTVPAARSGTSLETHELLAELQQRWPDLSADSRSALARDLLHRIGVPREILEPADESALRALLDHQAGIPRTS